MPSAAPRSVVVPTPRVVAITGPRIATVTEPRVGASLPATTPANVAVAVGPPIVINPMEALSAYRDRSSLSPEEQEIVINVYKYVKRVWPETRHNITDCTEKVAEITGLTEPSVYRVIRDRRLSRPPLHELIDPVTLIAIRRKIYRFYHESGHGVPRPENILREVHADPDLPNYSMSVFRRILHHLKFRHTVNQSRRDPNSRSETFTIPVE